MEARGFNMKMWMWNGTVNGHQRAVLRMIIHTVTLSKHWVLFLAYKNFSSHESHVPVFDHKNTKNVCENYV
jgi:hypothetical protein